MSSASRPRAVLVGPPGAGKSTVGRLLADALGVGFRDTDADVEEATGSMVADLFVDHGEAYFRDQEREAVLRALVEHDGVLALGGGAVLDPRTRAALLGHHVVFLDVSLADAAARVGLNRDRPLLVGNVRGQLKALLDERRPLYEEVATVTVSTDGRDAAVVAAEVLSLLDPDRQELP
jgi:shikimate kinase